MFIKTSSCCCLQSVNELLQYDQCKRQCNSNTGKHLLLDIQQSTLVFFFVLTTINGSWSFSDGSSVDASTSIALSRARRFLSIKLLNETNYKFHTKFSRTSQWDNNKKLTKWWEQWNKTLRYSTETDITHVTHGDRASNHWQVTRLCENLTLV